MPSPSPRRHRRPSSQKQPHQQHQNEAYAQPPASAAAPGKVRQRALRCGCLATVFAVCQWVTQQLQSSLLPQPACFAARQLTATSNANGGGGGPPSPEEFFGMSWLTKSNSLASQRFFRRGGGGGGGGGGGDKNRPPPSSTIFSGDVASTRPTFVLYVGVPEHPTDLQCQICTNPVLIDALEREGYVFLGTCPKRECDESSSSNTAAEAEGGNRSATTPEGSLRKVFSPHPSNFFTSSSVYEYSSSNTTLGIVPHTLEMSLAHGRRRNIPQLEVDFMLALDRIREQGRNAIMVHPGASVWGAKHIRSLSAFLNLHWDVHVLVGPYQPFLEYMSEISYSFVQTQYVESRTFRLWPGQRRDGRRGFDSLERSTINDVKQLIEENLLYGVHPMEMVGSNYARHFGRDRTHYVIPSRPFAPAGHSMAKDAVVPPRPVPAVIERENLLEHILCDMLGFARSCRIVKGSQQIPHQLSSGEPSVPSPWTRRLAEIWERIQVDALAVAAHDRHHVERSNRTANESSWSPADWTRGGVREQIELRLEQLGQSPRQDWPRICLDADQTEALAQYSQVLHERILQRDREIQGDNRSNRTATMTRGSSSTYEPGMESFVTDVLLCYVDTEALLNDDEGSWAGWFRDLVPGRQSPVDATTEPIVAEQ